MKTPARRPVLLGATLFVSTLLAGCSGQNSASAPLTAQGGSGKPTTGQTSVSARAFLPNPVQTTGDQGLTDGKDSAAAVPASAYFPVKLTNLDGGGYLSGDYARVVSETGTPVYGAGPFNFTRDQDQFEQVMAYFWVTEAQKYLQSLGFGTELPAVNSDQQQIKVGQWGLDNSYQNDHPDIIRLGKGGVDDAEDGEVIVHEYGHAVHAAQVPGFGSSLEAGSIGEAFGDYLALTVGEAVARANGAPIKAPLHRRLGRHLVHQHRSPLPAPHRHEQALPGGRARYGPRRRRNLVAGAVGHPGGPRGTDSRPHHHQRAVRLRARHELRRRRGGDGEHGGEDGGREDR